MGIEEKVGNEDNALQLRDTLIRMNLPQNIIDNSITILEKSYVELKTDLNGRYYSGCCI